MSNEINEKTENKADQLIKNTELSIIRDTIIGLVKLDTDPKHLKEHLEYSLGSSKNTPEMDQMHYLEMEVSELKEEVAMLKKVGIALVGVLITLAPASIQEVVKIFLGT